MKSVHYYLIKIISVIGILFGCFSLLGAYYAFNVLYFYKNIPTLIVLDVLVSIIGLVGGIGLLFFKKWGLYLLIFYVPLYWITGLITAMMIGKFSSSELPYLFSWGIIFIYLIWQRKTISNYREG